MKIVRQGVDQSKQPVQAECNHCHTVIEFLPFEAKYVSDQRDGDFYQIACPTCNNNITANVQCGYRGPG
jgi:hypothetical protein